MMIAGLPSRRFRNPSLMKARPVDVTASKKDAVGDVESRAGRARGRYARHATPVDPTEPAREKRSLRIALHVPEVGSHRGCVRGHHRRRLGNCIEGREPSREVRVEDRRGQHDPCPHVVRGPCLGAVVLSHGGERAEHPERDDHGDGADRQPTPEGRRGWAVNGLQPVASLSSPRSLELSESLVAVVCNGDDVGHARDLEDAARDGARGARIALPPAASIVRTD